MAESDNQKDNQNIDSSSVDLEATANAFDSLEGESSRGEEQQQAVTIDVADIGSEINDAGEEDQETRVVQTLNPDTESVTRLDQDQSQEGANLSQLSDAEAEQSEDQDENNPPIDDLDPLGVENGEGLDVANQAVNQNETLEARDLQAELEELEANLPPGFDPNAPLDGEVVPEEGVEEETVTSEEETASEEDTAETDEEETANDDSEESTLQSNTDEEEVDVALVDEPATDEDSAGLTDDTPPVDDGAEDAPLVDDGAGDIPPLDDGADDTPPVDDGADDTPLVDDGADDTPTVDDGADDTPPVDDGADDTPPVGDGADDTPPVDDGADDTPPVDDGADDTPPVDDGTDDTPPVDDGADDTPPVDDGADDTPPVDDGADDTPPVDDGADDTPPVDDGADDTPPVDDGADDTPPVDDGTDDTPPVDDGADDTPPVDDGADDTPPVDDGADDTPPVDDGADDTPPVDDGADDTPPVDDGADDTPPVDDGADDTPPVDDGTDDTPPVDDGADDTPPVDDGADDTPPVDDGGDDTPPVDDVTPIDDDPALTPSVEVRVSNATNNQDTINSNDGYDLVPEAYGETETVTGADMDIGGVNNEASVSYEYEDDNTVDVTLDSNWNSVKNVEVSSDDSASVTLDNFVHTDVDLGSNDGGDSTVVIDGAKRGNIETGDGSDVIDVDASTNNSGWGNTFDIDTNAGNDQLELSGDKGITQFDVDTGADNDSVTIDGDYGGSDVSLGAGNDQFIGGDASDVVDAGSGDDIIDSGSGDDILTGGGGNDTFVIGNGDGNVTITDFGGVGGGGSGESNLLPEHDTLKFEGEGLTADNMLLEYDGSNTIVTFEGVDGLSLTLEGFDFTDLDNLSSNFNIIFDGQTEGTDAYDVFNNHSDGQNGIWNKDSSTHLNNADNDVSGKNNSDDIINAMDGDDIVQGMSGNDTLRGQAGDDQLEGGVGDDILDGGEGADVAVFAGNREDYNVTQNEDGSYTVEDQIADRDGVDIVRDVETFRFADGEFAEGIEVLTPPVSEDPLPVDDQGNSILWSEDFSGMDDGVTVDAGEGSNWSTDDTASNIDANHGVEDEAYNFGRTVNHRADGSEDSTVSFQTEAIDISNHSDLSFSFDMSGGGSLDSNGNLADYVKVFAIVDGERHEVFAESGQVDGDGTYTITDIPQGDELVLEFESLVTGNDEYYQIDNLMLTETADEGDDTLSGDDGTDDLSPPVEDGPLPIDDQGNSILWSEDFSGMDDGVTVDAGEGSNWSTDDTASNIDANHGVEDEAYNFGRTVNHRADGSEDSTVSFQTEAIDISNHSDLSFSFDMSGGGSLDSNGNLADYVKVFAIVDGERHEVFADSGHVDGDGSFTISDIPEGDELVLEFESLVTGNDEYYQIDNLMLTETADEGDDTLSGDDGVDDLPPPVERDLITGGDRNDSLFGDDGANEMHGGDGNDKLFGGGGEDLMFAGKGNDELFGNNASDEMYAGDGNDKLFGRDGEDLMFAGKGNDELFGENGSDEMHGGDGNDKLFGGANEDLMTGGEGNDELHGGNDADTLRGGSGNDKLFGGEGNDSFVIEQNGGKDDVYGGSGEDLIELAEFFGTFDDEWRLELDDGSEIIAQNDFEITLSDGASGVLSHDTYGDIDFDGVESISWSSGA